MRPAFLLFFSLAISCSTPSRKIASTAKAPLQLTAEEVDQDLQVLKKALKEAYIGNYYPQGNHSVTQAIGEIESLQSQPIGPQKLCTELGRILSKLPDGHINVFLGDQVCIARKPSESNVGSNINDSIAGKSSVPYKLSSFIFESRSIPVLSFFSFPPDSDPRWKGFESAIVEAKKHPEIVFDLRGCRGGGLGRILQMGKMLINDTLEHTKRKRIKNNSPAAWILDINLLKMQKDSARRRGVTDLRYYDQTIAESEESLSKAKLSGAPPFLIDEYQKPEINHLSYAGRIYVLVDRECGSACEMAIEALKLHPHSIFIGQNSAGLIHFGQFIVVNLPNSQVDVGLTQTYFELFEEGFYEKIGYPPNIFVPSGDAFDYLKSNVLTSAE